MPKQARLDAPGRIKNRSVPSSGEPDARGARLREFSLIQLTFYSYLVDLPYCASS